ncbi:hypothetical protein PTTG_09036 [Puccinia triticina 1-1 BBBD Race 1]|uniref:Uncharacterized protein n=3 Tax=Puccinia triticina TaxID=208348 RepID=A0A180GRX7_PUCT1|nr:uncharacterized protein PtA15_10A144 [Puccinia triticina]OAV95510.1 hypothetical protein PTTG_09036 [Puccinia triticina 1-1 BBBD Race 1]WAQ88725.1 hypothetical protein PtA15_10A144 [Puccinia triticina]
MSDSEPEDKADTSLKIYKATRELGRLSILYQIVLRRISRPTENDAMVDELVGRNEVIDKLESILLPSIKDRITSFLLALDLQNLGKQLDANLDSIPELTSEINQILAKTTHAVESVSAPFEGSEYSDGRNLGRCKEYRCRLLCAKVKDIMSEHLARLFARSGHFLEYWELSRKDPGDSWGRQEMVKRAETASRIADTTFRLIDQTIEWSKKSDLAILQEHWSEAEEKVNGALEDLTQLAADPSIGSGQAAMDDEMTPRNRISRLARLSIPIVKLTRIFLNKITKTTPKKPLFTLDPEINSKSLELLSEGPTNIARHLEYIAKFLAEQNQRNARPNIARDHNSSELLQIPKLFQSTLLLLSFYLIPLPTTAVDHHSVSRQHFKSWFHYLVSPYLEATDRMLDALFDSQGFDLQNLSLLTNHV